MRGGIRASLARTGEDLGLALRRALADGLARRIGRQLEWRTAGQPADALVWDERPAPADGGAASDGAIGGVSAGRDHRYGAGRDGAP